MIRQHIVDRVVPPHDRLTADIFCHAVHQRAVDIREYAASGESDQDIRIHILQRREVLVSVAGAKGEGIVARNEVQRRDLIGFCRSLTVVFCFQRLLHTVDQLGVTFAVAVSVGHGDVIDEDTELTNAQFIHVLELRHQIGHALSDARF